MKLVALFLLLLVFSGVIVIQSQPAEAISCSLKDRCTVEFPLNCKNYATTNESIKLVLLNGVGRGMIIKNITAQSVVFNPIVSGDTNHNCLLAISERDKLLEPDEERIYTLDVSTEHGSKCSYYDVGRSKNRYDIKIKYTWKGSPSITHITGGELYTSNPKDFSPDSPDPLFPAFSDYARSLFLGLSLILLVTAVVCFVKKKTVLALVLMALFAISLFLAALAYLGMFDPICYSY